MICRDCPVCGFDSFGPLSSSGPTYVRDVEGPEVVICSKCKMVFLNPVMSEAEYYEFYNRDAQAGFVVAVDSNEYGVKVKKDDQRRADIIKGCGLGDGFILDVGTGRSRFVQYFDRACGIDISESRIAPARKDGINVKCGDINSWDKKCDVITAFHVLEHILEPKSFVDRAYGLLG